MISLLFLICTLDECRSITPPDIYYNVEECHMMARAMITTNQKAAERGEIPKHSVVYACYEWGNPA